MKSDSDATSAVTTHPPSPVPVECIEAVNLTQSWRSDANGSAIKPDGTTPNCDTHSMYYDGRPWFRFLGAAGNRLLDRCPPPSSCGTDGAMWSDATMPTVEGERKLVTVYGSWTKGCKDFTYHLSVLKCSRDVNDYVYRHEGDNICWRGYCGMA